MRTKQDTIEASANTVYSYVPVHGTRSVHITNNTGLYALVRLGGTDPPQGASNADAVIPPRCWLRTPLAGPLTIGFTTSPFGTVIVSETTPDGTADITYSSEAVVEQTGALGTAGIVVPSTLKFDFPYGFTPEVQTSDTPIDYTPIDVTGYTGCRLYMNNPGGQGVQIMVRLTIQPIAGPDVIIIRLNTGEPFAYTIPETGGYIQDVPLPLIPASAGVLVLTPELVLNPDADPVSVWPVLHL